MVRRRSGIEVAELKTFSGSESGKWLGVVLVAAKCSEKLQKIWVPSHLRALKYSQASKNDTW